MKIYRRPLFKLGYRTIQALETETGILASGKAEIYGCIFGRDSLITCLELLKTYKKNHDPYFLVLVKKVLLNLALLQGKTINIESGEEPGKCIHEFRPIDHEHLTKHNDHPWYVYPDNAMRNYDTVDATPLLLIACHEYYSISGDQDFLATIMTSIHAALDWIFAYGDHNGDGLIDYRFHPDRTYGGLKTQSWMDSTESLFREDDREDRDIAYPIAPLEAQAYTYLALRSWAAHFASSDPMLAERLGIRAANLKQVFNEKFILWDRTGKISLAFAIDGDGAPLTAARSSMGAVLWAAQTNQDNRRLDGILNNKYVPRIVERLLSPDLFEPEAGVRTLSSLSSHFDPMSYHNGSIWPHDTAMLVGGLERYGYAEKAGTVRRALLSAYRHFRTPVELFAFKDGKYLPYRSATGQRACKQQAWSAAALLAESA